MCRTIKDLEKYIEYHIPYKENDTISILNHICNGLKPEPKDVGDLE